MADLPTILSILSHAGCAVLLLVNTWILVNKLKNGSGDK